MPSNYSIGFMGTSLSWYWYYQDALINLLQKNTGRFVRGMNYGVNGADSSGGLSRVGQTVQDHPDFVTVEYSMNDAANLTLAAAQSNTISILNALKGVLPANRIFLMIMNPSTDAARTNLSNYYQNYRDLSVSQGVGIIDCTSAWTAYGTGTTQIPDGIHPTKTATQAVTTPTMLTTLQPLIT